MIDITMVASLGLINLFGSIHTIIIGLHVWSWRARAAFAGVGCVAGIVLAVALNSIDVGAHFVIPTHVIHVAGLAMMAMVPIWLCGLLLYRERRIPTHPHKSNIVSNG